MITHKGFECKIYKSEPKESKKGTPYWQCMITMPRRVNGYWGFRKDGEWIPYLEYWDANIYTDMLIDIEDELKVSEFNVRKWLKRNNQFDKGQWKYTVSIYGFVNVTQGYAVQMDQKRRKSSKIKVIVNSTEKAEDE